MVELPYPLLLVSWALRKLNVLHLGIYILSVNFFSNDLLSVITSKAFS